MKRYVFWIPIFFFTAIPVILNILFEEKATVSWSLVLISIILVFIMYPSWKVVIIAIFCGMAIKYGTEYYSNNLYVETLGSLVFGTIVHIMILIVVAHFRINFWKVSKRLEESEKRYKSLFVTNPDGIFSLDTNKKVIEVNDSLEKIIGFSSEEVVGHSYEPLLHPSKRDEVNSLFTKVIQGETKSQEYDTIVVHKNGYIINLRIKITPMIVDDKIVGVYGVAKDITELVHKEKELIETKNKLESFYNNTADAIDIIDLKYNVVQVNPAFEKIYGWKQEEIIGKPIPIIPENRIQESRKLLNRVLAGDTIQSFEATCVRKDGTPIEISLTFSPIYDAKGNIMGVSGITRDITEKKKYEERLKYLAFHDPLTGLPNRRLFIETVEQKIEEAKQYNRKLAVMFLDLDGFKHVNDTLGHDTGDLLLQGMAKRLENCVREHDILARLAGDEFTIFLPDIHEEDAVKVGKRIIESLKSPFLINGQNVRVSTSIGISLYPNAANDENLMKHADMAMYIAKQNGKNTYHIYQKYS